MALQSFNDFNRPPKISKYLMAKELLGRFGTILYDLMVPYEILFETPEKNTLIIAYKHSLEPQPVSMSALKKSAETNRGPLRYQMAAMATHYTDPIGLINAVDQRLQREMQTLQAAQDLLRDYPDVAHRKFRVFDPTTRNGIPATPKATAPTHHA